MSDPVVRILVPGGAERSVHVDDVDDVIGIAAELRQRDHDLLTVDELEEVARELDIEERYVERAVNELAKRRRQAKREQLEEARASRVRSGRLRRGVTLGLGSAAMVGLVLTAGAYGTSGSLEKELAEVERARAQVRNVVERRVSVEERWKNKPEGPERVAELTGADNRVSIERRRYDAAAARYNAEATGLFAHMAAWMFDVPDRVPLSSEIERW